MYLFQQLKSFFELLKTAEFSKGISFAVAAIIPLLVTGYLDAIEMGMAMAIGVLLASPSDVPGSLRRRVIGISLSVIIAVTATIITGLAATHPILFVPVLILLTFHFSMISVYGFRASLISFSGLLAVVLSMAQVASQGGIFIHALWIGAGGVWYLLFSVVIQFFLHQRQTDFLLAETFDLTAEYLEIRARLMGQKCEKREELEKELYVLQTSVNEKHELIREILITRRKNFGRSGMVRKRLLIFMELVDILELGMANPVNYERMDILFKGDEEMIKQVQDWSVLMAGRLKQIASVFRRDLPYRKGDDLTLKRAEIWQNFESSEALEEPLKKGEMLLVYRNLLGFKDKQHQKVLSIERLIAEWEENREFRIKRKDAARFLTTPEYNLKTLQDNLDLKSPIFRHSLRLTATMVVGFLIGQFFAIQNAYWILLTIIVIMRPGYALTRDRFKQRLYGTLIGGAVAVSLVFLIPSQVVYGILAVICLILAFSMVQRNYKTAAAFITLNVVFVYALLRPDVLQVIQYRVLDTVIGAGLAFLAAKFLWPTWEYATIGTFIKDSIKANLAFLKEVETLYREKKQDQATYRLARKNSFLAMGDLNAAFQRMAQEPKTEKGHLERTFRSVSLNQEFLSATASLGTFIRSHATTEASEHFRNYMAAIQYSLESSVEENKRGSKDFSDEIKNADQFYRRLFQELRREEEEQAWERLQEIQIIMDRLKWLLEISEGIRKLEISKP